MCNFVLDELELRFDIALVMVRYSLLIDAFTTIFGDFCDFSTGLEPSCRSRKDVCCATERTR